MESCGEAERLLDIYVAALDSFHIAQTSIGLGRSPSSPEFQSATAKKVGAHADVVRARRSYQDHVESHGCRVRKD
jgi:hypothetical protein